MRLDKSVFATPDLWLSKGYHLPTFDVSSVAARTLSSPLWVHFGAGNIFRAFQAALVQDLLNAGTLDRGLIVVEGYDYEIIDKMYVPHDNIGAVVTLRGDGTIDKSVVASVVAAFAADSSASATWERLQALFCAPSLQMVSFTITEKGYLLSSASGAPLAGVAHDLAAGPAQPQSYMGKVASLLHARYAAGALPIAMVSMDNCSHNGDKLFAALNAFAQAWEKQGVCAAGFEAYVNDRQKVSFPWTMIDKITPRPDEKIAALLAADGVEDLAAVVTTKSTYVAPFVNAEECQYLVIEDAFPNGRPPLAGAGVFFTDRQTVDKVEKMKVCTCLNPLHTCLAIFGCLLGYTRIADEMSDGDLRKLVQVVGYDEGLPVVVDPLILSPRAFIDEVVLKRIPNPFMPDTPLRIACDTSQKLPIRFGETIKAYAASAHLRVDSLRVIPLIFAGWLRYLMAVDDSGAPLSLSPDPLLGEVCPYVERLTLGTTDRAAVETAVAPLLHRADIFGVDLYAVSLAPLVLSYLMSMLAGVGAVRRTIQTI